MASNSAKSANSFMPLYGGDYLRDTMHLSCAEHGIYLRLLIHYWHAQAPLPVEQRKLEGIAGVGNEAERGSLASVLAEFFKKRDGAWHNNRMNREISKAIELKEKFRKAGLKSAEARLKAGSSQPQLATATATAIPQPSPKPTPEPRKGESQKPSAAPRASAANGATTWEAYSEAYQRRYKTMPVRNATVNACIAQFVKRIGIEESPQVAAFYVAHNNAFYVRRGHSVSPMLSDAEKLRTEWATGRRITGVEARSAEHRDAVAEQARRVAEKMERKDAE